MAAEEQRIQRIVRQIVSSEIGGATPTSTNVQLSSGSTVLPVNVVGGFENTGEELRSRFQMPRSLPANRGPRALIPDEGMQSPLRQIASNFNPRQNYGGIMSQRRPRRRQGTGPYAQGSRSCTITSSAEYNKDVILLPSPTWRNVPRGKDKAELQKLGPYVDAVRFSKVMSEDEVKGKIKEVFQQQLVDASGNPASFTFVKSCGSNIVSVNMESSQQMSGDILKHVAGQGAVYVMASQDLPLWNQESSVGTETAVSAEITEITESTQSTECAESTECTGYLQQIFPSKSREKLGEIMASSSSLEEATNRLLDAENILFEREKRDVSINEADDYPLNLVKRDPFTAMEMFQAKILKPNLPRQNMMVDRQSGLVVKDLFKMLKRGEIDIRRQLDVEFLNEDGLDASGLTKEYLNLVMDSMATGKGGLILFEGAPDHLLPVHKEEYLQSGYFNYVGKAISLSVVQGGIGFVGMSRADWRNTWSMEI